MMRRIQICDSFLVMLSVLFFVDVDGSLFLFLLAALLHEIGHLAVLLLGGGTFVQLRLTAVGAVIRYRLREQQLLRALIALAGPAVSLVAAHVSAQYGLYAFAGANLILGCFNLLPIAPLDGGTVVVCLLPRAASGISILAAVVLALYGVFALWTGSGVQLLLIGLYLLVLQKNLQKN